MLQLARQRVSGKDWSTAKAAYLDSEPLLRVRQMVVSTLEELSAPKEFPLLDRIYGDVDGRLWVRTFDNYGTSVATWIVVSPDGSPLVLVAMPRALRLLEIGRDYLIGFTRDGDGVERVRLQLFAPLSP